MSRVSTELTPSERAAYEWITQSLPKGYWAVMLFMAGMLIFLWFALGPSHPWYAVMVVMGTLILGPGVAGPVMRRVPRHWFRVPACERVLHRMLGVGIFRWLLARSGWERHVHKREFHATRAGLPSLEVALRSNASAHGTCFAIHVLLAALALFTGHPWGALWILLPGVVVHLYPVLLQRSIMLRLQPLLDRSGLNQLVLKP
jgi:Glycosyl-4,4'-diaponeurosporenoate acyltransferase